MELYKWYDQIIKRIPFHIVLCTDINHTLVYKHTSLVQHKETQALDHKRI